MYRQFNPFSEDSSKWPRVRMNYVGVFNPQKLKISKDPLTELPMETYFPAKAQWVMDSDNKPVNPPTDMKPTNDEYGFLTKPPLMLTTLEAAAKILGDTPISAIRVNVKGVETLNEDSEKLLQEVAAEIEQKTGLITDITLGSSPQLALTHLPDLMVRKRLDGYSNRDQNRFFNLHIPRNQARFIRVIAVSYSCYLYAFFLKPYHDVQRKVYRL
jgi:hypothetical protein